MIIDGEELMVFVCGFSEKNDWGRGYKNMKSDVYSVGWSLWVGWHCSVMNLLGWMEKKKELRLWSDNIVVDMIKLILLVYNNLSIVNKVAKILRWIKITQRSPKEHEIDS